MKNRIWLLGALAGAAAMALGLGTARAHDVAVQQQRVQLEVRLAHDAASAVAADRFRADHNAALQYVRAGRLGH